MTNSILPNSMSKRVAVHRPSFVSVLRTIAHIVHNRIPIEFLYTPHGQEYIRNHAQGNHVVPYTGHKQELHWVPKFLRGNNTRRTIRRVNNGKR